jgi:hypothetical protein
VSVTSAEAIAFRVGDLRLESHERAARLEVCRGVGLRELGDDGRPNRPLVDAVARLRWRIAECAALGRRLGILGRYRTRADETADALGEGVWIDTDDDRDILSEHGRMTNAGRGGNRVAVVPDGHSGVGHGLDIRPSADLLVGDRRHANRCRDRHLTLAEVRVPGLQFGHRLLARQARKIHRACVHAGQDAVVVAARIGEGDE